MGRRSRLSNLETSGEDPVQPAPGWSSLAVFFGQALPLAVLMAFVAAVLSRPTPASGPRRPWVGQACSWSDA
jgi:hypothetical protein